MSASSDRPRRVLVTGAAGFVGGALTRRLLRDGHDVHAVVHPESDLWRLHQAPAIAPNPLNVSAVDLAERDEVGKLVARVRPEWIFHLAAHGAYSQQTDLRRMVQTNLLGTMNVVDACLGATFEALIHTGSSSEYGFTDHAPSESEEGQPNSDYAATKLTATLYCRAQARRHDAPIATLRLYSVYGPYEEPSRFVPTLALFGLDGRLPPLVSPTTARDFVYVDDVLEAYLAAARGPIRERGGIFNVGTGRQTTVEEAVAIARRVLALEARPRFGTMPNRSWDHSLWVANPGKIQEELGWRAATDFETGFRRFIDWMRNDRERLALYRARSSLTG